MTVIVTGHTINKVLYVLEVLDRHNFDRVEVNNSLDTLYTKVFAVPHHKENEVQ